MMRSFCRDAVTMNIPIAVQIKERSSFQPYKIYGFEIVGATHEKALAKASAFSTNPPMAEEIHLWWIKSLRDEIRLRRDKRGGFNFI